jgi:ketosteroid isomerase-like protein
MDAKHDTDLAALLAAEQALYRAMVARDFAALERLLAPDLVYVHSTAVAESRDAYLAGVAGGLYEYASVSSREVRVRRYGDAALMDGICDMRVGAHGGPPVLIHLLFVLAWARDATGWRLVHRHAIRMPQPS